MDGQAPEGPLVLSQEVASVMIVTSGFGRSSHSTLFRVTVKCFDSLAFHEYSGWKQKLIKLVLSGFIIWTETFNNFESKADLNQVALVRAA